MADPVRNDEPLSSIRFPDSPSSTKTSRPGPVPVSRTIEPDQPLLPESATNQALGEWPHERQGIGRDFDRAQGRDPGRRSTSPTATETASNVLSTVKHRAKQVGGMVADRLHDVRSRFRVIRGRVESGELQGDLRERADELSGKAQRQARYARTRAEFYARNYPLQFIGGAAAAGFVIGFLLRMWRDE